MMLINGEQYNDKNNIDLSKFFHFIYCGGTCILFIFAFNGIYQYKESSDLLYEYLESKKKCINFLK